MKSFYSEWLCTCKSSLARNASWMFLGQGLSVVCQGIYFILLARLLGPTEYGIYAGVFAMVAVLSVYSPLGSAFTLIRRASPAPEKFAAFWGNVLMTTLPLGSLFVAVLVLAVPQLARSYSWKLVFCVAVGDCLCAQLTDSCSRVFQAFEKMRITALLGGLISLLRTVLAGCLLLWLHHATAQQWAVATLAVSFLAVCSAVALVTRYYGRPLFDLRLLRRHVGEGSAFAMSSSATGIYNNFDKAMLGHYGMNAANGIYTMAYRVVDICSMPITSVHGAAFPRFFKKGVGGVQNTIPYALRILKRTAPLAFVAAVAMALAAPLIPHLVGKSFHESVVALRWLCLLPVFRSFHLSAGDALTGGGHLNLRVGVQAAAAAFNFAVNLYLIPHYGWHGAAWSSLASDGLLAVVNWIVLLAICARTGELKREVYSLEA
jgi:O-antigen/teichoic acid export membrane protein